MSSRNVIVTALKTKNSFINIFFANFNSYWWWHWSIKNNLLHEGFSNNKSLTKKIKGVWRILSTSFYIVIPMYILKCKYFNFTKFPLVDNKFSGKECSIFLTVKVNSFQNFNIDRELKTGNFIQMFVLEWRNFLNIV